MSDGRKPPRTAPPPRTPTSPGMLRTPTNPGTLRVMTAARTEPLQKEKVDGPLGKRLAGEASNHLLNAVSVLKEALADFRQRDRFFKYKASIVAGWLVMTVASFAIACPGSTVQTGDMDARLVLSDKLDRPSLTIHNESTVQTGDMDARLVLSDKLDRPSLTIHNESDEAWEEVIVTINGEYQSAVPRVPAGQSMTITPKQLQGIKGAAPADLRFNMIQLRTRDDSADLTEDLREQWRQLLGPKR